MSPFTPHLEQSPHRRPNVSRSTGPSPVAPHAPHGARDHHSVSQRRACRGLLRALTNREPCVLHAQIGDRRSLSPSAEPALPPAPPACVRVQEKEEHLRYMNGFRVQTCKLFLEGKCPFDSYTCFDAHSRIPRRRKPQLLHGRFNYIPTRCRYMAEEQECPQDVHCRFAHATEEVIYHPSKYKTQPCGHPLDEHGHCTGYGIHCAKAHGDPDTRVPVYEDAEAKSRVAGAEDWVQFVAPEAHRPYERAFFMYVYKTRRCEGFPWNCLCNGYDFHRAEERRRGPDIRYLPMACPAVKPYVNSEWGDPAHCPHGDGCQYAHTLLELMYHPQVYKTGLCDHFAEHQRTKWRCVWHRRCAHAHGRDDLRSKDEAAEEWRVHTEALRAGVAPPTMALLFGPHGTRVPEPPPDPTLTGHPRGDAGAAAANAAALSPQSGPTSPVATSPPALQLAAAPPFVLAPGSNQSASSARSGSPSRQGKMLPAAVVGLLLGTQQHQDQRRGRDRSLGAPLSSRSALSPPRLVAPVWRRCARFVPCHRRVHWCAGGRRRARAASRVVCARTRRHHGT